MVCFLASLRRGERRVDRALIDLDAGVRAQTLEPLWNLLLRCEHRENCSANILYCAINRLIGGRTRTRTLDPLIKGQLLRQRLKVLQFLAH
jgi:hypothetical protein